MTREPGAEPRTYRFSADPADIDRDRVHRWLSEDAYWALGRPREVQERAFDGSLSFGMFDEATGEQVAYARVVTDGATFAWLCDVYVDPAVRGEGVGKRLVAGVIAELEPLGLRRMLLATQDAHGLYRQYGFDNVDPARWMERPMTPSTTQGSPVEPSPAPESLIR